MAAALALFPGVAVASPPRDRMEPLPSELLAEPIEIEACPGLTVIEWRPTRGERDTTSPSDEGVELMNRLCRLAIDRFPRFVKARHRPALDVGGAFEGLRLCLMPADVDNQGLERRNLNDNDGRFVGRIVQGTTYFWGYLDVHHQTIFMRNDALDPSRAPNPGFERTFVHELYHAMSDYSGQRARDGDLVEEEMAGRFEAYCGFPEEGIDGASVGTPIWVRPKETWRVPPMGRALPRVRRRPHRASSMVPSKTIPSLG